MPSGRKTAYVRTSFSTIDQETADEVCHSVYDLLWDGPGGENWPMLLPFSPPAHRAFVGWRWWSDRQGRKQAWKHEPMYIETYPTELQHKSAFMEILQLSMNRTLECPTDGSAEESLLLNDYNLADPYCRHIGFHGYRRRLTVFWCEHLQQAPCVNHTSSLSTSQHECLRSEHSSSSSLGGASWGPPWTCLLRPCFELSVALDDQISMVIESTAHASIVVAQSCLLNPRLHSFGWAFIW